MESDIMEFIVKSTTRHGLNRVGGDQDTTLAASSFGTGVYR